MTQCSGHHLHDGVQYNCIRDIDHLPPHMCIDEHMWLDEEPVLPYPEPGGEDSTAGWSGSDTSHERAERERDDGTVARRQRETIVSLDVAGPEGLTWKELGSIRAWHHGQSSSVLSVLHKDGRVARLVDRRDRCHVYVLIEYVNERDTQPHGGRPSRVAAAEAALAKANQKLDLIRALAEKYALLDPGDVLEVLDAE